MNLTMLGRLSECVLLVYRTPADHVRHLLPRGLELNQQGEWAFWNVVACRVDNLRPAGWPRWWGVNYQQVAYRLYVRARTAGRKTVEGLYFVRSDADHRWLARAGNCLSDFRFHPCRITLVADRATLFLRVKNTRDRTGEAELRASLAEVPSLPESSCFSSPSESERFLKYCPLGLSCTDGGERLKLAEVMRDDSAWQERPIKVVKARWSFFERLRHPELVLERATRVAPIDYAWRLGRQVKLSPRRAIPFLEL